MTTHPKRPLPRGLPTTASYERPAGMEAIVDTLRAIPRVPHQGQPRPGESEPIRPEGYEPPPARPAESEPVTPATAQALRSKGPPYCPRPGCGGDSKVIDSRPRGGRRFSTYESYDGGPEPLAASLVSQQLRRMARLLNRSAERLGGEPGAGEPMRPEGEGVWNTGVHEGCTGGPQNEGVCGGKVSGEFGASRIG